LRANKKGPPERTLRKTRITITSDFISSPGKSLFTARKSAKAKKAPAKIAKIKLAGGG
jgi:hypothetical protein